MYTLGINAAFHDCSACLVKDGTVIAAAEEERFTRIKHGKRPLPFTVWQLPFHAIASCLRQAGITLRAVDHVAYAYDPSIQLGPALRAAGLALPLEPSVHGGAAPWEALALAYVVNAPRQLRGGAPHHLRALFDCGGDPPWRWHFVEHHRAHEASAFLAAPLTKRRCWSWTGVASAPAPAMGCTTAATMPASARSISRTRWACCTNV